MEALNSFDSLESARAYQSTAPKVLTANDISMLLSDYPDDYAKLKAAAQSSVKIHMFLSRIDSDGRFDFRDGDNYPDGAANLESLEFMRTALSLSDGFVNKFIAKANPTIYPYANLTQEQFDDAVFDGISIEYNVPKSGRLTIGTSKQKKATIYLYISEEINGVWTQYSPKHTYYVQVDDAGVYATSHIIKGGVKIKAVCDKDIGQLRIGIV